MTSWPRLRIASDVRREAFEPRAIQPALLGVDQQRRADFDDHALGVGQAVGGQFAVVDVHGRQYCHLLSGAASPNMRPADSNSSSKKDDFRGQRVRTDRRAVVRGLGERGDVPGAQAWMRIGRSWRFNISTATSRSWTSTAGRNWTWSSPRSRKGWSGSKAEKDAEEDEDEDEDWDDDEDDEDDDDLDDEDDEEREEY